MPLDPKLNQGMGFEEAVAQPSVLGGVADLAGLFINTSQKSGPSAGDKTRAFNQSLNNDLVRGLDVAAQMRGEGLTAQANRRERQALHAFAKAGGNINAPETQGLIENFTGRPADRTGLSEEEFAYNKMIESEAFQTNFISTYASHPDATDAEREQLAISRVQRSAATAAIIEETKHDWNVGEGQSSRLQLIADWQKQNEGALFLIGKNGGSITQDDVQAASVQFGQLEAALLRSRPAGIDPKEWEPIEAAIKQTKEQLALVGQLTSTEELSADAMQSVIRGIRETEGFTTNEKNLAIVLLQRDPKAFVELGAFEGSTFKEMLEASLKVDFTTVDEQIETGVGSGVSSAAEGSSTFTEGELSPHETSSPRGKFEAAETMGKLAGTVKDVVADPKVFAEWVSLTNSGLAGLYSMAAKSQAWATAEGYNKYFTPRFFKTMDEVRYSGNQNAYRSLYNKTNETIDANITALRSNIVSQTEGDFVKYDKASNSLQFDRAMFESSDRISGREKEEFLRLLDSKYGGDFTKAITDKGSNLPTIRAVASELQDTNVTKRIQAIKQLETVRKRLAKPEELEGADGDTNVDGSAGEDTLQEPAVNTRGGNDAVLAELRHSEGFRSDAYWDVDAWRTGYGSDTVTKADGSIVKVTKDTKVTKADAERDLARRSQEFSDIASRQVGREVWTNLAGNITDGLIPLVYNYGSIPKRILDAVKTGDAETIAVAVEGLAGDNDGINRKRRMREAAIIRGKATPPNTASPMYTERPMAPPSSLRDEMAEGGTPLQGGSTGGSGGTLEGQEVAQGDTPTAEAKEGSVGTSPERAQQVWSELSQQTKGLLLRLFGNEEGVREALIKGELTEEELS